MTVKEACAGSVCHITVHAPRTRQLRAKTYQMSSISVYCLQSKEAAQRRTVWQAVSNARMYIAADEKLMLETTLQLVREGGPTTLPPL